MLEGLLAQPCLQVGSTESAVAKQVSKSMDVLYSSASLSLFCFSPFLGNPCKG